jgi:hypothetical protein
VHAVVVAVTTATKIVEPTQNAPHVAASTTDILARGVDQHAVMPVVVPNAVPQQTQGVHALRLLVLKENIMKGKVL